MFPRKMDNNSLLTELAKYNIVPNVEKGNHCLFCKSNLRCTGKYHCGEWLFEDSELDICRQGVFNWLCKKTDTLELLQRFKKQYKSRISSEALYNASCHGNMDVVCWILDFAKLSNRFVLPALVGACEKGQLEVAMRLLASNPHLTITEDDLFEIVNAGQWTVFQWLRTATEQNMERLFYEMDQVDKKIAQRWLKTIPDLVKGSNPEIVAWLKERD